MGFITLLRARVFAFSFFLGMTKGLQNCGLWVGEIQTPAPIELRNTRSSLMGCGAQRGALSSDDAQVQRTLEIAPCFQDRFASSPGNSTV